MRSGVACCLSLAFGSVCVWYCLGWLRCGCGVCFGACRSGFRLVGGLRRGCLSARVSRWGVKTVAVIGFGVGKVVGVGVG